MSSFSAPSTPGPGQPVYILPMQQRSSVLARIVTLVIWLGIGLFLLMIVVAVTNPDSLSTDPDNKLEERYHSLAKDGVNKVAVIEIDGIIEDGEKVKKQIDKVLEDSKVKAVVLRVDSPGGTVSGSDFIYHHLRKISVDKQLPVVVSMGGLAASGGYYVSMACSPKENVIFAEPTTWTGSIGVIIPHYNVAGLMEKWEIEDDSVKSAPLKGLGSMSRKMTPEEKKVFEELVKESFDRFKGIVKTGRPKLTADQLEKATTGQIFTTDQALALGLVDKKGFVEDAIARAMEMASLDAATTKAVKYHRPKSFVDTLAGQSSAKHAELNMLRNLTSPRGWYMFSWPMITE